MNRGDIFNGWYPLVGEFPPTLNKEDDPTKLKPNESPDCYGVDMDKPGRLKAGSIPTGTARSAPTKTVHGLTYNWYYNRLWRSSSDILTWGAPYYDDMLLKQGVGRHQFDATIVTFMPCFEDSMWVATASGSYILNFAKDNRGFFNMNRLSQEMTVSTAANACTIGGMPVASNANGVFMYDGKDVKELTAKVRNSLGNFANKAITADYTKGFIIGTSSFGIDVRTGNIFDYGTSGFRFTSRTMAQDLDNRPFQVEALNFVIEHSDTGDAEVTFQTKIDNEDWYDEDVAQFIYDEGLYSRMTVQITNPTTSGHRFQIRIIGMDSNIAIKDIGVAVKNLAIGSSTI